MLGQIIYNVEDYSGTGSIISTGIDMQNHTEEEFNRPNSQYTKINIFESNFLTKLKGVKNITKLGIQAPPGTKFVFNTIVSPGNEIQGPQIMIGQSGIYELDENLNMDGLTFIRPKGYALDLNKSDQLVNDGKGLMSQAKENFERRYKNICDLYGSAQDSNSNQKFWQEYEAIHKDYVTEYNLGRSMYVQGVSGVYIQDDLKRDLRNVIIDFIYTTEEQGVN